MPGWTILRIREINKGDYTNLCFYLEGFSAGHDLEPARYARFMSAFSGSGSAGLKSGEISAYVTTLVPEAIRKRLAAGGKTARVYLGLSIEEDTPSRLEFPLHTLPWEAVYTPGSGAATWRTAYSAVRLHTGATQKIDGPVSMGIFCCEYTPLLAERQALRETYAASPVKLDQTREIIPKTAAADFAALQKNRVFYCSCHGAKAEDGGVRFLSPGRRKRSGAAYFLTTSPGDPAAKHYRAMFADPAPAVVCFDACFSAYDQNLAAYLLDRGCHAFIGHLFEAEQDGMKAGTPTAREILKQLLWSGPDGRHGICDSVLLGVRAGEAKSAKRPYNTVVCVNGALPPERDAFNAPAVPVNIQRWLPWMLALASLLAGAALGEAWFFRAVASAAPIWFRLLWEISAAAVLFLAVRLFLPFHKGGDRKE